MSGKRLAHLAALIAGACLVTSLANAQIPSPRPAYSPEVEARIARITGEIVPVVVAEGAARVKATLVDRMATLQVPGVSVAVINDGEIEWARGFGVTKLGGPPVTTETLFQAGSISKPVSAMGILTLVEQGKLDLDADVNLYLKSWKVPDSPLVKEARVTLRRLLTHTAGLTVHGFPGYANGRPIPTILQVLDGATPANTAAVRVDTTPGALWRYSGGGYTVAQLMASDVAGKPFPELLQETVLGPIGMSNSTFEQPLPPGRLTMAATPYRGANAVQGGPHIYPEMAAAGLWTTATDLAKYALEVQAALDGRSDRVLTQAMAAEMLKPSVPGGWGLGPQLGGSSGRRFFQHGGVDEGFVAQLITYEKGDGAVVMTNSASGGQLAMELIRTIALEYGWNDHKPIVRKVATVDPSAMNGLVGAYRLGRFSVVEVTREGNQLFAQTTGQQRERLHPSDENTWFYEVANVELHFDMDAGGRARAVTSRRAGQETRLARMEAAEAAALRAELAAKVRDGTPDPRAGDVLRRTLEGLARGEPDYSLMGPATAEATRQQLGAIKSQLTAFGPLKTLVHRGVGPAGADIFFVAFEKEPTEWRLLLSTEGKIENITFSPPQAAPGDAERTAAFKASDADRDGKVDKAAYKIVLDLLGYGANVDALFAQRDTDKDGFIAEAEDRSAIP